MEIGYFAVGIGPTIEPECVRRLLLPPSGSGSRQFGRLSACEHVVLLASKYPYSTGRFPWFNLLPDQVTEKIKCIEELLQAHGRNRSEVKLAVSPYANPIRTGDLKRYRGAGVDEIALLGLDRARTESDMIAGLEQMAREFVEPAAKL